MTDEKIFSVKICLWNFINTQEVCFYSLLNQKRSFQKVYIEMFDKYKK